jgi:hypothetical protein
MSELLAYPPFPIENIEINKESQYSIIMFAINK